MLKAQMCSRFSFDGTKCPEDTEYVDGWCRQCDGFVTAEPPITISRQGLYIFSDRLDKTQLPRPDKRVHVTMYAANQFIDSHQGTRWSEVKPQINELLRDLIHPIDPESTRTTRSYRGAWGLSTLQPKGYSLLLSDGGEAVLGYRTDHRELTYAQAKLGVKSRSSLKPEKRSAKRFGVRLAQWVIDGGDVDQARMRAFGHGHPKAIESFERTLKDYQITHL